MRPEYVTPCADKANDPEDWFIEKDGRQYVDAPVLTDAEVAEISRAEPDLEHATRALDAAHADRIAENLVKRRHARDKCHVECYLRTQCLGVALAAPQTYGTYGGYFPEQIREIVRLRDERASHDADVAAQE